VSRAHNSPGNVSPEKLERIRAAAAALGYVPDKRAGALRRRSSGVILALMPRRYPDANDDSRFYWWFTADVIINLQDVLADTFYSLELAAVSKDLPVREILRTRKCDAVLSCLGAASERDAAFLKTCGTPYIICAQWDAYPDTNLFFIDEESGGRGAAAALSAAGLKKPAHITGFLDRVNVCGMRWRGFKSFYEKEPFLIDGELGIKGGYESGKKLVPFVMSGAVDSVFVVNDLAAVGVMQALLEAGVRVPERLGLVSYDNLPFIQTMPIVPATMDIGFARMHRAALKKLLSMTGGPETCVHEPFAPVFVPGKTLAAPGV
jgi:DNA-binding LacI/PurR family transcriptional regulator